MQVGLPAHHLYTSQIGSNMAGESHGITSQHVIARNKDLMVVSPDSVEEFQCWTPNWYFSRREIEDHSPSRKDGIDSKKETQLQSLYCSFVHDLGLKLKVPQQTIATAMMFCHRFYLHQSHAKNNWQTIATVSIFLACKVEETPRPLVDVTVAAYEMLHKSDRVSSHRIKQKDVFEKQKKLILMGERLLMATVGFDFNIQHPYKPLVAALKKIDISHKDLPQVAWNFVNDWLRTTLCLQYKPHYIAAGSMYLAAKFCKVKLPSERGNAWWQEFDISYRQLEEVIKQMLNSLGENKRMQKSSSHQNGTCDTLVKKTTIYSPQSLALDGYKATSQSMHVNEEKAQVCGKYRQPSDGIPHNNQTFPGEESCVVRSGGLSQCQTSDSGSSRSGVEDGNRTDEDGDREKLVKPNQTAACVIVSECRDDTDNVIYSGVDKKTEVGVKSDDASIHHTQAVPSDENCVVGNEEVSQCQTNDFRCSQSVVGDDIRTDVGDGSQTDDVRDGNPTDDVTNPAKLDEPDQIACLDMVSEPRTNIDNVESGIEENVVLGGEFGQSNDPDFHNSQTVPSEETCAPRSEVSNSQTSNCESNKNVVEDGNRDVDCEDLAKLGVTDQTAACNTFSDSGTKIDKGSNSGGLCKIDTDRIKEALRKRKREKLAKARTALDSGKDNDSWIVEELENGIELEASSVQKRQKL